MNEPGGTFSDEELMKALQEGDYGPYECLYTRHSARLYAYLRMKLKNEALAQDVFQEVMLVVYEQRDRFDCRRKFLPWFFSIAHNRLVDAIRCNAAQFRAESLLPAADLSTGVPAIESRQVLAQKLSPLSDVERKAVWLRLAEGLPFSEVAKRVGLSLDNSRQLVSRALKKLRGGGQ